MLVRVIRRIAVKGASGCGKTTFAAELPLAVLLRRLLWRTSHRIHDRVELWSGNRESWRTALWGRDALFPWTIRAFVRHRREWPRRFVAHPGFVRLRTTREARHWLEHFAARPSEPGVMHR
jgi:hypothetical protein